ncbi:hypothetical protein ACQP1K_07470 [Sphaerimonospora sp. CA-214678]
MVDTYSPQAIWGRDQISPNPAEWEAFLPRDKAGEFDPTPRTS